MVIARNWSCSTQSSASDYKQTRLNTNHFEEKEEGGEEDDSVGGGDGDGWGVTGLATGGWTHRYYGLCKHTFTQCNDHYSISTAIKTSTIQQSFPDSSIWFWTIFTSFGKNIHNRFYDKL